jgi:hypothetical protein
VIGRSSIIGSYIQSAERLTSISDVQRSRKQEQLVKQYYKRYILHAVVLDGHGTPLSKQLGVVRLSRCVPESVESVVFSMAHSGAFSVSVSALERGILVHLSQPSSPGILAHISHTNGSKIPAKPRGFRLIPVGPGLVTRRKSAIFPGSFKERRTSTLRPHSFLENRYLLESDEFDYAPIEQLILKQSLSRFQTYRHVF